MYLVLLLTLSLTILNNFATDLGSKSTSSFGIVILQEGVTFGICSISLSLNILCSWVLSCGPDKGPEEFSSC